MTQRSLECDVLILGAGAAGLMAAVAAAESAHAAGRTTRVLLVEKNRQAGIKVLVCGGGRGNLTNAGDREELLRLFGRDGRWLSDAFARLDNLGVCAVFARLGVPTKTEVDGRVFPVSDRARDLVEALLRRACELGTQVLTGWAACELVSTIDPGGRRRVCGALLVPADTPVPGQVRDLGTIPAKWRRFDPATWSHISAQSRASDLAARPGSHILPVRAGAVILAVGGASYVRMGTTGDGYRICESLGVPVVKPRPAIVPLVTGESGGAALAGVAVPDAVVTIDLPRFRRLPSRADLLFTHFGLSGPAVLNLSEQVALLLEQGTTPVPLRLDLLPNIAESALSEQLKQAGTGHDARKQVKTLLARYIPERLAEYLLGIAGSDPAITAAQLSRSARRIVVERMKRWAVRVHATKGMSQAMVTAGGVPVREVDPRTMQCRRVNGLYLVGEMLDLTGPSGGYNLQLAWSTGWVAGEFAERAAAGATESAQSADTAREAHSAQS